MPTPISGGNLVCFDDDRTLEKARILCGFLDSQNNKIELDGVAPRPDWILQNATPLKIVPEKLSSFARFHYRYHITATTPEELALYLRQVRFGITVFGPTGVLAAVPPAPSLTGTPVMSFKYIQGMRPIEPTGLYRCIDRWSFEIGVVKSYVCNRNVNVQGWTLEPNGKTLHSLGQCLAVNAAGGMVFADCTTPAALTFVRNGNALMTLGYCLTDRGIATDIAGVLSLQDCDPNDIGQRWIDGQY